MMNNGQYHALRAGKRPRNIRGGFIPSGLRVLVLAPHPDDFDVNGVTLKYLSSTGSPVHVGVVPGGSGVQDSYLPDLTPARKSQLREREQRNSLRFFGLPEESFTFLEVVTDAEDQLADLGNNLNVLAAFVREHRPDIVFLPHGNDANSAHKAMYSMVRRIAAGLERPPALLLCRDPKTVAMRSDWYCPFGEEEAAWKGELLRFHDTQQQRNLNTRGHGLDRRILDLNRQSARELELREPYAEVFELEMAGGAHGNS